MSRPLDPCQHQVGIQHYPPYDIVTCPNPALPGSPFCATHGVVPAQPKPIRLPQPHPVR